MCSARKFRGDSTPSADDEMKRCLSCACGFDAPSWHCPACSWEPALIDGRPAFAVELAEQNSGFSSEYFVRLAALESGHFWFESRNKLILWALEKYFPGMQSILEIGCGTGFVLTGVGKKFPHVRRAGSEVFREGLNFAASRMPDTELLQMDARKIPYVAEFDVIGAFDVLEHIEEDQEVLRQMYDSVKPGGGIIVTVPQHRWLWSAVDDYSCHKRRYTRPELTEKVKQAGFRIVRVTSFITLLLPVLMASRSRYKGAKTFDSDSEVRIGAGLNGMLTAVLSLERRLIQSGISLPAGGSLLLIGRRV
jgi:SAM-dependent methyltransferase